MKASPRCKRNPDRVPGLAPWAIDLSSALPTVSRTLHTDVFQMIAISIVVALNVHQANLAQDGRDVDQG
jgi:hypothetical protein